jgi:hypothetical protein
MQISFTAQHKPEINHCSSSLPMKATKLKEVTKMEMEYVPTSQYDVTRCMLVTDSQHKATE